MGMIYSDFQAFFGVGFEAFGPEEELLQQICKNVEAILFYSEIASKIGKIWMENRPWNGSML